LYLLSLFATIALLGYMACNLQSGCALSSSGLCAVNLQGQQLLCANLYHLAVLQVRRAQQLLTCYRAVAALRSDESFQEDASEPAVQAALHEMALANSFEK
jgi:hypothetical protein